MEKAMKKFNTSAFVVLMIVFSGIGLPITGIANHFYGFSPLTVARHAWMSAHNTLGLLFILFTIWHILLNRRALLNQIRGRIAHMTFISLEAVLAGMATILPLLIIIGHVFHM